MMILFFIFLLFNISSANIFQRKNVAGNALPRDVASSVASTYAPWNDGYTTRYPPWNYQTTTRTPYPPWNYQTITRSPWDYMTTRTPYPPWTYTTATPYPPWNSGSTAPPTRSPPSLSCPRGYTLLNDKKCVKLIEKMMHIRDAANFCKTNTSGPLANGNLVSIHNAIDNRALVNMANSLGHTAPLWVGLNCEMTGNPSSCKWMDDSGNSNYYNNFLNGNPFIDVGHDVYMLTTGGSAGRWVSGDGNYQTIGFFCEETPLSPTGDCSNPFNGFCYDVNLRPELDEVDARAQCKSQCGDILSIHSLEENNHVLSIFDQLSKSTYYSDNYLRIGGFTDGFGKYWFDGTNWNFDNLDLFNPKIGSCFAMAVREDIVPRGTWISNHCAGPLGFVCKTRQGATC